MEHEEQIKGALEQIKENVKKSEEAIKGHEEHVKELDDILKLEKPGRAKDELTKVRNHSQKNVDEIEKHIK